jgi:hypothetical protein
VPYTPLELPISNYAPAVPSAINTPNSILFSNDLQISAYNAQAPTSSLLPQQALAAGNNGKDEDLLADEENDTNSLNPNTPPDPAFAFMSGTTHRRSKSAKEASLRNVKRAYVAVERSKKFL